MLGTVHVAFGASEAIGGTDPGAGPPRLRGHEADDVDGRRHRGRPRRRASRSESPDGERRPSALLAVPNVSDGCRAGRSSTASARDASAPAGRAARRALRRRPQPHRLHDRRRRAAARATALEAGAAARRSSGSTCAATRGAHPRIGALDVCPIVWPRARGAPARRRLAIAVAEELAASSACRSSSTASWRPTPERRERALLPPRRPRRSSAGGWRRASSSADYGPRSPHPTAGAVLVTARPPLAAFNVELDAGSTLAGRPRDRRRACASRAAGSPGVRAIAIELGPGRVQISTNVHDPVARAARRGRRARARRLAEASRRRGRSRPSWSGSSPQAALRG